MSASLRKKRCQALSQHWDSKTKPLHLHCRTRRLYSLEPPTMRYLEVNVKRSVPNWKSNWTRWSERRMNKFEVFEMNWRRWKNERIITRITSLKLKIVLIIKNKNIEQKPKPSKNSGMSTTPMSWSWRTLRRTRQNHLYPKGKWRRLHSNHGQRLPNFYPGREVSFMKFVLLAITATTVIGKRG